MVSKNIVLIIIVLLIGIGITYSYKKKTNKSLPNKETQQEWDQWQDGKTQPTQPTNPPIQPAPQPTQPTQPEKIPSPKTYAEALQLAKQYNLNIFLYFEGNNCIYCEKMKKLTFTKPAVQTALSKYIIFVSNTSNDKSLAFKYKVIGIPAYYVIDKNETITQHSNGYKDADEFIEWLNGGYDIRRVKEKTYLEY